MPADRSFVEKNDRESARLRSLVERLSDEQLRTKVNEHWTIAGVLGHAAFWDGRALVLAGKLQRGEAFTESDAEPDDVSWINDGMRALLHAIAPREAAQTALRIAEETDARVASLTDAQLAQAWPADEHSPLNPTRASHRREHLDDIEAALARRA